MHRADLQRFARRDWQAVEAAETAFWLEAKQRLGAVGLFALVHRFQTSIRVLRPDWPTQRDRDEDLEHHTKLAEKLGRVILGPRR